MDTTFDGNQYMEEQELQSEVEQKTYRYAGFWMRFWAFLLDQIVIFSVNGILIYPVFRALGIIDQTLWFITVVSIFTALVSYLYFTILTKKYAKTLGKQVFGLKVISQKDEKLTWDTVIFREVVGRFIHHALFINPILYLIVAFSNKKEGIHDKIADTYVVHEE